MNPTPERVTDPLFQGSLFFDPEDLLQVKYELLRRVERDQLPVSQATAAFGVSRPTFYHAHAAFEQGGLPGLLPHKPGPRQPHKLTPEVLDFLRRACAAEPGVRAADLAGRVRDRFGLGIHPNSIRRALRRQEKKRR